ncbi:MAG TPA: class I SAM-dependent methyltransferase [Fluviicola sp.]|nr:class I SAM-dependent methyltransferase [Fluviicola sp.]
MNQIDRYTEYVNWPCEYERLQWLYTTISKQRKKGKVVRILEVGCGKGDVAIPLGLINFSEVKGIDVQEEQVRIGNERNSLRNVTISYEKLLDCAIYGYDFIVLTRVMEDASSYKEVLRYVSEKANPLVEIQLTVTNAGGRFASGTRTRFSVNRLKKEVLEYGLEVFDVKKVYVFSPMIARLFPKLPLRRFSRVDHFLAQLLPNWLVSSHYYRIRKKRSHLKVVRGGGKLLGR